MSADREVNCGVVLPRLCKQLRNDSLSAQMQTTCYSSVHNFSPFCAAIPETFSFISKALNQYWYRSRASTVFLWIILQLRSHARNLCMRKQNDNLWWEMSHPRSTNDGKRRTSFFKAWISQVLQLCLRRGWTIRKSVSILYPVIRKPQNDPY